MNIFAKAVVLVAGATAATVLLGAPASADNGDNQPGCQNTEICFWYDTYSTIEKQFWNTNWSHSNYKFMINGSSYVVSNQNLHDNAHDITNKDTQCWVSVGNIDQYGNWVWQHYANDWSRRFLGALANKNDAHVRDHNPNCS
ncbi:hypothetical protein [Actinokineospora iranica]|uniref:Peptidase inhibitor family I36 n=1 Tax=Actinokineospora iranica TaxID=1271860 RepID=A0A1G6TBJ5_9PSEU|nr:hypothetical protein [Actinokineospora iranica]SDD25916.1 hypothetical protein SAMN05216174_10946 [Actinokineospora iranica]